MLILKWQVNFSSDFSSFFRVITYNSSVSHVVCGSCIFYYDQKDPMNLILTFSNVLIKICQISHVIFQTTIQFFFKFCMNLLSWNILLCTFLGQTLYTLHKRDQSKCKFFRLFSAQIKIHQILVIFETKNKFLFKFCTTLIVRIGVSNPPQKHHLLLSCQAPPCKSTNCPSPSPF